MVRADDLPPRVFSAHRVDGHWVIVAMTNSDHQPQAVYIVAAMPPRLPILEHPQ